MSPKGDMEQQCRVLTLLNCLVSFKHPYAFQSKHVSEKKGSKKPDIHMKYARRVICTLPTVYLKY